MSERVSGYGELYPSSPDSGEYDLAEIACDDLGVDAALDENLLDGLETECGDETVGTPRLRI